MKRIVPCFLVASLLLIFMCACSHGKAQTDISVDIEQTAADIVENVEFRDELDTVGESAVKRLYDMPENAFAVVYIGSGATAEEVAVFEFEDADSSQAFIESAKKHIDEQIESYENYVPEEVPVLESAIVESYGRYVVVCVTDDPGASEYISGLFE